MEDWVVILLVLAAVAAGWNLVKNNESFTALTSATPSPSMGTKLADSTSLPLTDATNGMPLPNGCQPPTSIDTDLLPKPCVSGNDNFAEFAPNPSALANMNFLDPTKYVGMDTIQASKRNSSYDIRSVPPIIKCPGAWGNVYQSTIQADPWRKPLDCMTTTLPA